MFEYHPYSCSFRNNIIKLITTIINTKLK
uniref:Uncharacterized protein n=1 Tax=Arundo donax TaxID=35708 RepID=A0A0A9HIH5_ARUDO